MIRALTSAIVLIFLTQEPLWALDTSSACMATQDVVCQEDFSVQSSYLKIIKAIFIHDALNKSYTDPASYLAENRIPIFPEDAKALNDLKGSGHRDYYLRLQDRIYVHVGYTKVQFDRLFEQIKNHLFEYARSKNVEQRFLDNLGALDLFQFSLLSDKTTNLIISRCGRDGLEKMSSVEEIEGRRQILFCPGLLLEAPKSKYSLQLNAFYLGHELGHNFDVAKLGYQSFAPFLDCLAKNYNAEFQNQMQLARQWERRTITSPLMERALSPIYQHIQSLSAIYTDRPSSIFRSNLFANEITADLFGFYALSKQMEKIPSNSDRLLFLEEFLKTKPCTTQDAWITHPMNSIRNVLGLRHPQIQMVLHCSQSSEAPQVKMCQW